MLGITKKFDNAVDNVTGNGSSKTFDGFPETLTNADFEDFSATTLQTDEYVNLTYYELGQQEQMMIGSEDERSGETGKVYMYAEDTADSTEAEGVKARLTYSTRAGRKTDPVFSHPTTRLSYDQPDDQRALAPQPWNVAKGSRGSPPRAQGSDRINVEVKGSPGKTSEIAGDATTEIEVPVQMREE